jgi:hypothetical protein
VLERISSNTQNRTQLCDVSLYFADLRFDAGGQVRRGRCDYPDEMDRRALLDQYRTGFDAVVDALSGITPDELDRRPPSGEWTAREICHHMADSEATAYIRLRRLIAEDNPTIVGYDSDEFARRLHYDRPIEPSLDVLRAVRTASLQLLESLTPAEWQRAGTHTESGPYSVEHWLALYANHPREHAEQIRRARRGAA